MATEPSAKVRYAVAGLGYFAQAAVLPAFAKAGENSELAALISDDPAKLKKLKSKYGIDYSCSYDEFDDFLSARVADALYIALPNSMHCDFAVRAARAGMHVLCEKPLAVTEEECETMIAAAGEHRVKLMTAYRLHFEEANLEAVRKATSGEMGDPRFFISAFSQPVVEGNIRLKPELGGGTLYDLGVYCINAARYLFRDEPTEVFAFSANDGEGRFAGIDEMTSATLRFPGERLAAFTCSFGAVEASWYQLLGAKGAVRLDPAYDFNAKLKMFVTDERGRTKSHSYAKRDHVAAELVYFSDCVLHDKPVEPDGREGLADVRIVRALYRSAERGEVVKLEPFAVDRRPTSAQEIDRSAPWTRPSLIHAAGPSGR
jgi:glucose-fructose oxidoreductase